MSATAIVFDLDGVLVDSRAVVERAWRRWGEEQDVSVRDLLAVVHGRPSREVIREFAPHLDTDRESARLEDWEMRDPEGVAAIPGAHESVTVAAQGPWAIVTSAGREMATERLRTLGFPVPPVLVTSDDVTRGKPDPEPYALACRELGFPPADCVAVEDAPAGIAAASHAGMTVLAVTTTHAAAALAEADQVFGSMLDVSEHLGRLRR